MRYVEEKKSPEVRGLENTLVSLRTQMRLQNQEAQELAEAVKAAFLPTGGIEGVTVVNAAAALRALKLADDVLA